MNRPAVAAVIFFSVFGFVALQAWVLRRWTRHRLEVAALELAEPVDHVRAPSTSLLFTPFQRRAYLVSFLVSTGLLLAGAILGSIGDKPSSLSLGLLISSVAIVLIRQVARYFVGRAAVRSRGLPTLEERDAG